MRGILSARGGVVLVALLVGCGGGEKAAPPPAPSAAWTAAVKPWYCGPEALPPKSAGGEARQRDVAVKIVPGKDGFTALHEPMDLSVPSTAA